MGFRQVTYRLTNLNSVVRGIGGSIGCMNSAMYILGSNLDVLDSVVRGIDGGIGFKNSAVYIFGGNLDVLDNDPRR